MMQILNKKRKLIGNKGFSLVELIIVIAIMAVLVAILAPQYLKYVEKSRQSADAAYADSLLSAVKVMLSDDSLSSIITDDATVVWTGNGATTVTVTCGTKATEVTEIQNHLSATLGSTYNAQPVKSNLHLTTAADDAYTITIDFTNGIANVTADWL